MCFIRVIPGFPYENRQPQYSRGLALSFCDNATDQVHTGINVERNIPSAPTSATNKKPAVRKRLVFLLLATILYRINLANALRIIEVEHQQQRCSDRMQLGYGSC